MSKNYRFFFVTSINKTSKLHIQLQKNKTNLIYKIDP